MTTKITQARGRERRRILLAAAEELLETHQLDELNLSAVASRAGVPKGSAYHFYRDIYDLYAELAAGIGEAMAEILDGYSLDHCRSWSDIVGGMLAHGGAYLDAKASRRQLIWGAKSPSEIKRSDRNNDRRLSRVILDRVMEHYDVPEFPRREEIFYHAVEIADLMFCLCMLEHERLTQEAVADAQKGAIAYLRLYLPEHLPPREAAVLRFSEAVDNP